MEQDEGHQPRLMVQGKNTRNRAAGNDLSEREHQSPIQEADHPDLVDSLPLGFHGPYRVNLPPSWTEHGLHDLTHLSHLYNWSDDDHYECTAIENTTNPRVLEWGLDRANRRHPKFVERIKAHSTRSADAQTTASGIGQSKSDDLTHRKTLESALKILQDENTQLKKVIVPEPGRVQELEAQMLGKTQTIEDQKKTIKYLTENLLVIFEEEEQIRNTDSLERGWADSLLPGSVSAWKEIREEAGDLPSSPPLRDYHIPRDHSTYATERHGTVPDSDSDESADLSVGDDSDQQAADSISRNVDSILNGGELDDTLKRLGIGFNIQPPTANDDRAEGDIVSAGLPSVEDMLGFTTEAFEMSIKMGGMSSNLSRIEDGLGYNPETPEGSVELNSTLDLADTSPFPELVTIFVSKENPALTLESQFQTSHYTVPKKILIDQSTLFANLLVDHDEDQLEIPMEHVLFDPKTSRLAKDNIPHKVVYLDGLLNHIRVAEYLGVTVRIVTKLINDADKPAVWRALGIWCRYILDEGLEFKLEDEIRIINVARCLDATAEFFQAVKDTKKELVAVKRAKDAETKALLANKNKEAKSRYSQQKGC